VLAAGYRVVSYCACVILLGCARGGDSPAKLALALNSFVFVSPYRFVKTVRPAKEVIAESEKRKAAEAAAAAASANGSDATDTCDVGADVSSPTMPKSRALDAVDAVKREGTALNGSESAHPRNGAGATEQHEQTRKRNKSSRKKGRPPKLRPPPAGSEDADLIDGAAHEGGGRSSASRTPPTSPKREFPADDEDSASPAPPSPLKRARKSFDAAKVIINSSASRATHSNSPSMSLSLPNSLANSPVSRHRSLTSSAAGSDDLHAGNFLRSPPLSSRTDPNPVKIDPEAILRRHRERSPSFSMIPMLDDPAPVSGSSISAASSVSALTGSASALANSRDSRRSSACDLWATSFARSANSGSAPFSSATSAWSNSAHATGGDSVRSDLGMENPYVRCL